MNLYESVNLYSSMTDSKNSVMLWVLNACENNKAYLSCFLLEQMQNFCGREFLLQLKV